MDNVLQFPPPSSSSQSGSAKPSAQSLKSGKDAILSLKQILGKEGYKQLKSLTKDFASGTTPPEQYVDEAASLFDRGLGDEAFWDHIPSLINDIPNTNAVNRAMRHLESVRMANQMQEMEFGGGGGKKKKPINYVLPTKKKESSWGNSSNSGGGPSAAMKVGGNAGVIAQSPTPAASSSNNATKKNGYKKGNGGGVVNNENGGKKSKAKKKNNELKALAFGA